MLSFIHLNATLLQFSIIKFVRNPSGVYGLYIWQTELNFLVSNQ